MIEPSFLFNYVDFHGAAQGRMRDAANEIDSLAADYLLDVNGEESRNALYEKHRFDPPRLHPRGEVSQNEPETVYLDRAGQVFNRQQPNSMPAVRLTYFIPFDGDAVMFRYQPSSFDTMPPAGRVSDGELTVCSVLLDFQRSEAAAEFRGPV